MLARILDRLCAWIFGSVDFDETELWAHADRIAGRDERAQTAASPWTSPSVAQTMSEQDSTAMTAQG